MEEFRAMGERALECSKKNLMRHSDDSVKDQKPMETVDSKGQASEGNKDSTGNWASRH